MIGLRGVRLAGAAWLGAALFLALASPSAVARPEYARKEGKTCVYCHVVPGGARNFRGLYYKAHNLSFEEFDNQYEAKLAGVKPDSMGPDAAAVNPDYPNVPVKVGPALRFAMKGIDGNTVNLARYQGDVVLMVNTASLCGNTPQYSSLEKMYQTYHKQGFEILGFPANDFGHQEPGDNKTIKAFCTEKYHVTFPMFAKIVVKGDGQAPLYKFLTSTDTDPKFAGDIRWNFDKFLIDRSGNVVARFAPGMDPLTPNIVAAVDAALAAPRQGDGAAPGSGPQSP